MFDALAASGRNDPDPQQVRHSVRRQLEVREALDWMWPVLTPAAAAARPVRLEVAAALRRQGQPRRSRGRPALPAPLRDDRRRRVHPRRRAAARRGPGPARPPAPPQERGRPSRRRRAPHLRPHRRRRGPGPLADAAAHAVAALAQRQHDHRRRHRPGHGGVGPRQLGRGPRPSPGAPSRPPGRAHDRLPHPRSQHGAWPPGCCARPRPTCEPPRSIREDGTPPRPAPGRLARRPGGDRGRRHRGPSSRRSASATSP